MLSVYGLAASDFKSQDVSTLKLYMLASRFLSWGRIGEEYITKSFSQTNCVQIHYSNTWILLVSTDQNLDRYSDVCHIIIWRKQFYHRLQASTGPWIQRTLFRNKLQSVNILHSQGSQSHKAAMTTSP